MIMPHALILRATITVCVSLDSLEVEVIAQVIKNSNSTALGEYDKKFDTLMTDIDECSAGTDMCATNATCANTEGDYFCSCDTGYHGNGFTCNSKYLHQFFSLTN